MRVGGGVHCEALGQLIQDGVAATALAPLLYIEHTALFWAHCSISGTPSPASRRMPPLPSARWFTRIPLTFRYLPAVG